jgi:hypothetical protein
MPNRVVHDSRFGITIIAHCCCQVMNDIDAVTVSFGFHYDVNDVDMSGNDPIGTPRDIGA